MAAREVVFLALMANAGPGCPLGGDISKLWRFLDGRARAERLMEARNSLCLALSKLTQVALDARCSQDKAGESWRPEGVIRVSGSLCELNFDFSPVCLEYREFHGDHDLIDAAIILEICSV